MSLGDFETQKKNLQEQIATAETEAGFTLDMSEVEKLNKQLEVLEANKLAYEDKVEQVETPASENQVKQITELGGTEEELVKREEVQDEKVEEVKEVLEKNAEEGVIDVALFEKVSNMKSIKECSSIKEYNTYYEIRKKELDEKKEEIKELRNSIEKMKEGEIDKAVQTEMDVLDSKIGDIASQVYNTREECLEYPAFKFLEDVLNSVFKENPEKVVESILGGSRMNYLENMSKNYSLFRKEEGNNYIIGGGTDTDQVAKLLKKQMEIIQEKELVSVEKINQAIDQVVIKLLGDDKKDYVPVIDMINNSGLSDTYKEYAKKTFFENFDKNSLSGHRTIQDLENALN